MLIQRITNALQLIKVGIECNDLAFRIINVQFNTISVLFDQVSLKCVDALATLLIKNKKQN